jgi:hypothetical protein
MLKVGVLVLVCAAAVAAAGSGSASTRPQVIRLLEVGGADIGLDGQSEEAPPKAGDRFYFANTLYAWAGTKRGKRVGRDEGLCTFTQVAFPIVRGFCTAQFRLPAGTILVESFIRFTEGPLNIKVPITGGTGAYANARGWAQIRDIGPESSSNSAIALHLMP